MAFVQFSRVSLAFAGRDILKEVSLYLAAGSRSCLAGVNGSGKSTLMKVIAGKIAADSGDRAVQKGTRIAYLPQSGIAHRGRTLREEAETAYSDITAKISRQEDLGRILEKHKGGEGSTEALLEEYHRIQDEVEASGYYMREQSVGMVLDGLGFSRADLDRPTGEFSGGWQMRIALAKVLLEKADILLLDEPTNYLDIEAKTWLEEWLRSYPGGYLLVSHDRYFLDVSVNEVLELFQGSLKRYAGNYSSYEKLRQQELNALLKRYAEQQEEIARAEDIIRRFRYKASKAAMVQERIKMLEKMERIEIPESLKKISIAFPPPPHSGRIAFSLTGIGKSYGSRQVLSGLDLLVESGEKLVVVGRNGAGKTTLLRILAGKDQDFQGEVRYGAGISAAYFSQDDAETQNSGEQILASLEAAAPMHLIPRVRDMLGAFLFRGDDVYKPLSVLSGGEKSRLALLRMLLRPVNLLILDEPTNHLDIHSKDILLSTLKAFTGTVIFVSHDRSFMEELSTKTLELSAHGGEGAAARLFYGNYAYYLDRREREAEDNWAGKGRVNKAADDTSESGAVRLKPALQGNAPGAAERREAEKQRQTLRRRLERQEGEILRKLEELEAEKKALEAELAKPEVYTRAEKARAVQARIGGLDKQIGEKTVEWEEKAAELEETGM
ncbi:MAG: ABC-F family ATP-binding cassette domain-containing protein [Treponema sp.]|jgi:ATP-binding cassette subfamily F protein 3|nr:ABC-F family ATP-binding cassette domain-containing protein [Treponema sp.]